MSKVLRERIENMEKLMTEEKAGDNNKIYLNDLKSSINDCKRSLEFYIENPNGVQMVNGG